MGLNTSQWLGSALMGAGTGMSFYGQALGQNALADRADERAMSRQQSLEEIRQRYQQQMEAERRDWQESQTAKERKWQESQKEVDFNRQRAYDIEKVNPESELGGLMEAARDREQERSVELRKVPYASAASGGIQAKLNPANYTTESYAEFLEEFNKLKDAGMEENDAYEQALINRPPDYKPTNAAGSDAAVTKATVEQRNELLNMDRYTLESRLMDEGVPEDEVKAMSMEDMRALLMDKWMGFHSKYGAQPGQSNSVGGPSTNDPLGLFTQ